MIYNPFRVCPSGEKVPLPGLEPGRLLTQPRGCKPRTSTCFVTGAETLDVGAGEPSKTLPAPTALRPSRSRDSNEPFPVDGLICQQDGRADQPIPKDKYPDDLKSAHGSTSVVDGVVVAIVWLSTLVFAYVILRAN